MVDDYSALTSSNDTLSARYGYYRLIPSVYEHLYYDWRGTGIFNDPVSYVDLPDRVPAFRVRISISASISFICDGRHRRNNSI